MSYKQFVYAGHRTSIRLSPKQANISTLHRPKPRTATSFSMRSSSLALMSIWAVNSPESNFSASPLMYSALRWERPAVPTFARWNVSLSMRAKLATKLSYSANTGNANGNTGKK
jgi:hypothetical protein